MAACKELDAGDLPRYILDYESIIGNNRQVDPAIDDDLVAFCKIAIPQRFEAYAAILNPFYVSNSFIDRMRVKNFDKRFHISQDSQNYYGISWKDLYTLLGIDFDTSCIFRVQEPIRFLSRDGHGVYFPGEGRIEDDLINTILTTSTHCYPHQDNCRVFFNFLMTVGVTSNHYLSCTKDQVLQIKHSDLFHSGPSVIHLPNEKWLVMTDYDSDVSYVGGESHFVNELVRQEPDYFMRVKD